MFRYFINILFVIFFIGSTNLYLGLPDGKYIMPICTKGSALNKKKSKTYDSIYKALPFVHIGMIYFPSGSPKYKFVEPIKNITNNIFIKYLNI
jgi:hypothetical protein